MKWTKICALTIALALIVASRASAGTIDASYAALGGTNFVQDQFVYSGNAESFNAAEGLGTRVDSPGPGVDSLVPQNFDTFCVEVDQFLYINSNNHHANVLPLLGSSTQPGGAPGAGPVFFDATRTLMLERLWGGFESSVNDQQSAAAFQLAVWELAFDTDQTLVGGGSLLHAYPADLANPLSIASVAEGWLAQVRNLSNVLPIQPLLLLTDPSTQDLITPAPLPTPEPASIALFSMGAIGLLLFRWRKK